MHFFGAKSRLIGTPWTHLGRLRSPDLGPILNFQTVSEGEFYEVRGKLGQEWRPAGLQRGLAETTKDPGSLRLAGKSWTWHISPPTHRSLEGEAWEGGGEGV